MTNEPTVLIVEDEPDLANLYAAWLREACDVETAYNGSQALEAIDETVDIVLLDRRMPGLSGDEVLSTIRDRDLDTRVAMVTAVEPDFDIIEMGFDDYLVKPVSKDDLLSTVDQLLLRSTYDDQLQEYFAMASKKATLESEKNPVELDAHEEYREVSERVESLRERADAAITELDDFESAFLDFPSGQS